MPELPEVQTVVDGLISLVIKKEIINLEEYRVGTIQNFIEPKVSSEKINETELRFGLILKVERRGKYILIYTSNDLLLVIHLRMTGKLIYESTNQIKLGKHVRASINFKDNSRLIFDDVRTFGKIQIFHKNSKIPSLVKLGQEPLSEKFNVQYLTKLLNGKSAPIKNVLLDQGVVAGIGNIYVAEILYRAKVLPQKSANQLEEREIHEIVKHTKQVLKEALLHNGTTISDYRNIDDKTGDFQNFLRVYGKKICPNGHIVERMKQAGRTTFYCAICQK